MAKDIKIVKLTGSVSFGYIRYDTMDSLLDDMGAVSRAIGKSGKHIDLVTADVPSELGLTKLVILDQDHLLAVGPEDGINKVETMIRKHYPNIYTNVARHEGEAVAKKLMFNTTELRGYDTGSFIKD